MLCLFFPSAAIYFFVCLSVALSGLGIIPCLFFPSTSHNFLVCLLSDLVFLAVSFVCLLELDIDALKYVIYSS